SRKLVVLLSGGGLGRLCVLAMALIPVVLADHRAVVPLIVLSGVRWFAGSVGHPAWVSLLADIVPVDLRRIYVSRRMLGIAVVAAIGAPLMGFLIRALGGVSSVEAFQWAFLLAAALGFVSTFFYSRIEEPPRPAEGRPAGSTRAMLRDRPFVQYLAGTLLL